MTQVFTLTLRQVSGVGRLALILLLALIPVALAVVARLAGSDQTGPDPGDFQGVDFLLASALVPLVAMAFATAAFGNDLEDKTLSFILLRPISRWKIALAKLAAPFVVAAPFVFVSAVVTIYAGLSYSPAGTLTAAVSLLVGLAVYSVIFGWAGLITSRALAFAIVYVFVWEGLLSTLIEGVRYLSVRGFTLAIIHGLDINGLAGEAFGDRVIELPAAIGGAVLFLLLFFYLTVRRLNKMDVP